MGFVSAKGCMGQSVTCLVTVFVTNLVVLSPAMLRLDFDFACRHGAAATFLAAAPTRSNCTNLTHDKF